MLTAPHVYACVGSEKAFLKAASSIESAVKVNGEKTEAAIAIRLDSAVPENELHIKDIHGHLFASFTIKS